MKSAFGIVMDQRKELVEKVVELMQQGDFFHNMAEWDARALSPQNPLSQARYRGANRLKLMVQVVQNEYTDPRWATFRQFSEKGYKIKKGERGVLCEKWIFDKEMKVPDENGDLQKIRVPLDNPKVSYFTVFNAQQVEDFPPFEAEQPPPSRLDGIIRGLMDTSECPVSVLAQDRAYYSPGQDRIVLPLRSQFKDDESFAKTLLHEMSHSTGHGSRLARDMSGIFGSEDYAKEELRAELGSLFTGFDLGLNLKAEHYEDHSDYLRSWIGALKNDYNELFRACADAEKISSRLISNYTKMYELDRASPLMVQQIIPEGKASDEPDRTVMRERGTVL